MTNGRNKGKGFENDVARRWRVVYPNAKRHLEFQSAEAEEGRDVDNTQPFALQAKCWKSTPSIQAIEQIRLGNGYTIRCAILKRTRSAGRPGLEVAVVDHHIMLKMVKLLIDNNLIEELTRDI